MVDPLNRSDGSAGPSSEGPASPATPDVKDATPSGVAGLMGDGASAGVSCSTTEAARRLGVSNAYVQQLRTRGKLVGHRIEGARTVWRVDGESLERFAIQRERRSLSPASARSVKSSTLCVGSEGVGASGERFDAGAQRETDRAVMLELELVAARQELAVLQAELGWRDQLIERLRAENHDLTRRLSSVAEAHIQVVRSLIPPTQA